MRPAVVWSRSRGSHLTLFDFSTSPSLASLCAWYLTPLFPLSSSTLAMTETHTSTHYPSPTLPRLWLTELGPALPLSQLGNCLRPPSGRGPQNFRKEGVEGKKEKKKSFSDESKKNPAHSFDQKTKFLLYPIKHW